MRRSNQFFVVLLHLLGCSKHRTGIVSVHPWPIVLEELTDLQDEVVWIQYNGLCLGPTGTLTECGDATLWHVTTEQQRKYRKQKRYQHILIKMLDKDDDSSSAGFLDSPWWRFWRNRRRRSPTECLVRTSLEAGNSLEVRRCTKKSVWKVDSRNRISSTQGDGYLGVLLDDDNSAQQLVHFTNSSEAIQFRFVRYKAVPLSEMPVVEDSSSTAPLPGGEHTESHRTRRLEPAMFPELKTSNRLLFKTHRLNSNSAKQQQQSILSTAVSHGAALKQDPNNLLHTRIRTHPFASSNNIWTDPQTGLQYPVDLTEYVGSSHLLMGVGQYRKGYVIKVYGIAYYVSQSDALSDPLFEDYAQMECEDLRSQPQFYDLLREMPSSKDSRHGNFDRTLIIKINMQLAAETIRSSLQADWRYLTDEAKHTLISSSLKPRPASNKMLALIKDTGLNPSRCSCSQTAPPEYNADESCCARGTELAFTWLKSGQLEVRLNGELMETFPRSDIAAGIFFEYLRFDDPISPELRDNVVTGFPYLLAPIAQIKGFHSDTTSSTKGKGGNRLSRWLSENVVMKAGETMNAAQSITSDVVGHAMNAAKIISDGSQGLGKELERRRELFVKHALSFPDTISKLPDVAGRLPELISRIPELAMKAPELMTKIPDAFSKMQSSLVAFVSSEDIQSVTDWVASNITPVAGGDGKITKRPPNFSSSHSFARWFGETYYAPDEIGPMIIPPAMDTGRQIFLALVHLYLLLLFIVSFPGSYTTRTKLLIRRKDGSAKSLVNGGTDISTSLDSENTSRKRRSRKKRTNYVL